MITTSLIEHNSVNNLINSSLVVHKTNEYQIQNIKSNNIQLTLKSVENSLISSLLTLPRNAVIGQVMINIAETFNLKAECIPDLSNMTTAIEVINLIGAILMMITVINPEIRNEILSSYPDVISNVETVYEIYKEIFNASYGMLESVQNVADKIKAYKDGSRIEEINEPAKILQKVLTKKELKEQNAKFNKQHKLAKTKIDYNIMTEQNLRKRQQAEYDSKLRKIFTHVEKVNNAIKSQNEAINCKINSNREKRIKAKELRIHHEIHTEILPEKCYDKLESIEIKLSKLSDHLNQLKSIVNKLVSIIQLFLYRSVVDDSWENHTIDDSWENHTINISCPFYKCNKRLSELSFIKIDNNEESYAENLYKGKQNISAYLTIKTEQQVQLTLEMPPNAKTGSKSDSDTSPDNLKSAVSEIKTSIEIKTPTKINTPTEINTLTEIKTPIEINTPTESNTLTEINTLTDITSVMKNKLAIKNPISRADTVQTWRKTILTKPNTIKVDISALKANLVQLSKDSILHYEYCHNIREFINIFSNIIRSNIELKTIDFSQMSNGDILHIFFDIAIYTLDTLKNSSLNTLKNFKLSEPRECMWFQTTNDCKYNTSCMFMHKMKHL